MALEHCSSRVLATRLTRHSRCHSGDHKSGLRKQDAAMNKAIEEHQWTDRL
jgi:hypothetical protein